MARTVLTESALLCAVSAFIGGILASVILPIALRMMPDGIPRLGNAHIGAVPLGVAIGMASVAAMLFTLLSMLTWRRDPSAALKRLGRSGAHAGRRLQDGAVLIQTAVTVLLLVACGLSVQSVANLLAVDPGFE